MFMRQMMDFYYPAIENELSSLFSAIGMSRNEFYSWLSSFPIEVKVPITDAMIEEKIPEILAARNTVISPVQPDTGELRKLLKSVQKE
jgi:alcohol dehydrogenase class IV